MRILQLTSHLQLGGVTTYVATLARALRRLGHEVIVAADHGAMEEELARAQVTYWPVPLHTSAEFSVPVWRAWRALARRLRETPVDVIHAHTRVAQVVAAALSSSLGYPVVTTWHGVYRPNLGRMLWPAMGQRVIAISEPVAHHLVEVFQVEPSQIRTVLNGVDIERFTTPPPAQEVAAFKARWGLDGGAPVIGAMGRLASGRVKGFDLFLEMMVSLARQRPDVRGIIVGEGPRRPFIEEKLRAFGLEQQVRMVGAVSDVRIPLAAMSVFVFPVRWPEGFGLTLVEAMASGLPVVATRVGAVPSIVEHGRTGWLVEPDQPEALAQAVLGLLQEPARARAYAEQGKRRAAEAFTLERMARQIDAVYREVARGGEAHG